MLGIGSPGSVPRYSRSDQLTVRGVSAYIYIGGLGELVRLVRPPLTGRSASFRLRFRFVRAVRAVRAGEAKLRGRACIVVLIAGPPGS